MQGRVFLSLVGSGAIISVILKYVGAKSEPI